MVSGSERALGGTGAAGLWLGARAVLGAVSGVRNLRAVLLSLLLVGATTLGLLGVDRVLHLSHVSIAYVAPVLMAATLLGLVPALIVAVASIAASAFIFYPPIYDLRVSDTQQLVDLTLFVIVAVTTSQLAAVARTHAARAEEREGEIRALYNFSRRLAVATEPSEISAAIQDHLSVMTGRPVAYFAAGEPGTAASAQRSGPAVPEVVREAVDGLSRSRQQSASLSVDDVATGTRWLVRSVSHRNPAFGLLAIDMGTIGEAEHAAMQQRIDILLADATATLERLDVARAISEAKLRAEAETLREALMGSVTHGLRTPLASIIGSTSILVETPAVAQDARSASLAGIVRDEAERLDHDIQRLLNASRISSAGVRPHLAWTDPADIVNAALASRRRALAEHRIALRLPEELPLVHVDPVLIEQALGQLIDNAAKYSAPGSTIHIEGGQRGERAAIAVRDEGAGLTAQEQLRVFERFYRGERTAAAATGSGLGLWIAQAFVAACGGRVEATSPGADQGATITMLLPAPSFAKMAPHGEMPGDASGDANE